MPITDHNTIENPVKVEPDAEANVHNNMSQKDHEESSSSRKRRSALKSTTDKNRRKRKKQEPADEENNNVVVEGKENNGHQPSPTTSHESLNTKTNASGFFADRNVNAVNKPPEAGVITTIKVENFMCHKKLTVDLCRNVNFIYGQNGSGKSAILAALQICLGAGARRTNRARSLKELVRKGSDSNCAKVSVTLLNKGADSFEHDAYGDYIKVERTIALRGGYNGYKLYNATKNEERSRSKKDLVAMLDRLNIQIDNPVAVLDQEDAKNFLKGKADAKYKFFMKATELERIDNSYASTMDKLIEMENQAERLQASVEQDKDLVRQTKKAYEQHKIISKLEGKKGKLETMLGWANYKIAREEEQEKIKEFNLFKDKAEKKKQELTQAEAASQEMDDPNDERRNRLQNLAEEGEKMSAQKRELEKELKRATEPRKVLGRQFKLLKKEEERANMSLLQANRRLQAKRDEIVAKAGSAESDQARRNQRLQVAEAKLADEKNQRNELKQAVTDAFNSHETLEPEVQGARQIVSQLEHQLRGIDGKIRSMESSSGNSIDIFGQRCAKVKQMVDIAVRRGQFEFPVLGPIGFYCKIQPGKKEFASLAELAIGGGILDRFVVFNHADRKRFQMIRQQAGCQSDCGVLQQSQHPSRYGIPTPPQGVETVATVIQIQNDMIFNCLVDHAKIDTKALSRSKKESEDLLLIKDNNNRDAIRGGKIKEVYLLPKGDNWKVTKGNIQMISNTRGTKQTIGADMSDAIEDAKNDYQRTKEDLEAKKKDYSRLEHEHTNFQKQWNIKKRQLQKNERHIDDLTKEIEDIRADEVASIDNHIDTSEEEEDVSAAQACLDEIKENQRKAEEAIREQEPRILEIQENVKAITARNVMIMHDISQAEQNLSQHYQAIEKQKEKIAKKRRKLLQFEEIVAEHAESIRKAQDESSQYLKMAQKIQHYRDHSEERRKVREENDGQIDDIDTADYNYDPTDAELGQVGIPQQLDQLKNQQFYGDKIKIVENKIRLEKVRRLENSDDEPTAFAKYVRAKKIYQAKAAQIVEINTMSQSMGLDMKMRRDRWLEFRHHVSEFSTIKFNETLNIKGSSGCIEFDHEREDLQLIVQKDASNEQSQQKDIKALSGGERSFTTMALLLALGEMLETPFRVMDEFDVFLDPVTRKKIIDTLIEVGQSMRHRQFIFITPQDVSNVVSSSTVKILQMHPPIRRTVAGGHEQQTLDFSASQH